MSPSNPHAGGKKRFMAPLVLALGLLFFAAPVRAQTAEQQKCLSSFDKDFAKTAAAEGKSALRCLRDFGRGKLAGTVAACLLADRRGKVARAKDKTAARFTKLCRGNGRDGSPRLSPFGIRVPAVADTFAVIAHTSLLERIFGTDIDAGMATNAPARTCQQAVVKDLGKCHDAIMKSYVGCARVGLRRGTISDRSGLEACIAEDGRGKIEAACGAGSRLERNLSTKCRGVDLVQAFPECGASDTATLRVCLERQARCTACLALDEVGDLQRDCDLVDDGAADGSCVALTFPGTSRRFHPGHYLLSSGPSISQSLLDEVSANPNIRGVSIAYEWVNIEGDQPGSYDFSNISAALDALRSIGKHLLVMVRDKSFAGNPFIPVPLYMQTSEYAGGYVGSDQTGYIAKRWVPAVNDRYLALLDALATAFADDPTLEVVKTPESAAGPASGLGPEYSATAYATELMRRIDTLADSFPNTVTALYLNWLPGNTTAMLDAITAHARARGVGIGGPDVHPDASIAAYPYYPGYHGITPIMVEVQWDNFEHTTPVGDTDALLRFAVANLRVNYIAWLRRPGFESNLLSTVSNLDFAAEFPVDPTR